MTARSEARAEQRPSSAGSARLIAAGILLSRIAGLVRERVFAHYLGTSAFASVFRAALRIPNLLQNLLGEGTLSASFIPVYARLLEDGREKEAGRVAGAMFGLLLSIAAGLSLLGVLAAPLLTDIFVPGFQGAMRDYTIACMRIIFPMTGVLVLSAWALGILNSHRQFFVSYVAPVLWNAAMIATLIFFGARLRPQDLIVALSWGGLVGGALQFLVQLPWVFKLERELHVRVSFAHPDVRIAVRNAGPALLGRGVVQISAFLDAFIASFLAASAVAVLSYAQLLYILPVSLFGMSVAAAELPEMARERAAESDQLKKRLTVGLRRIALLVVPSTIAYILLADVVVGALFQTGNFNRSDTVLVGLTLAGYSIGLIASTATRLLSSAFFAMHDTRTPAKIAFVRVSFAAALGGIATVYLRGTAREWLYYGPVALATASGLGAWVEWFLLRKRLAARLGHVSAGRRELMRMIAAATIAALIARGIYMILPDMHPILQALLVLGPFGLGYFVLAHAFGIEEAAPRRALRVLKR